MSITAPPGRNSTASIRQQLKELRADRAEQRGRSADLRLALAEDGSSAVARELADSVNTEQALNARIEDLETDERQFWGQSRTAEPVLLTGGCSLTSTKLPPSNG